MEVFQKTQLLVNNSMLATTISFIQIIWHQGQQKK